MTPGRLALTPGRLTVTVGRLAVTDRRSGARCGGGGWCRGAGVSGAGSRWLYLARHGEAPEGGVLTATGRRQAELLAERLAEVPLRSVTHSPEQRAAETAGIVVGARTRAAAGNLTSPVSGSRASQAAGGDASQAAGGDAARGAAEGDLEVREWDAVGDYVPHVPEEPPVAYAGFFDGLSGDERRAGEEWAELALARFAKPPTGGPGGDVHELVVTHAWQVAWFLRAALGAPADRWLGVPVANCGLTVLRYTPGRPAAVVVVNDLAHLPAELRWTGFPPEFVPR